VRSEAEGDWNIYWYVLALLLLLPLTHSLTCCCCCCCCTVCETRLMCVTDSCVCVWNRASVNTIRQMFNPETGFRLTDMQ
jgi:hypothetical protein